MKTIKLFLLVNLICCYALGLYGQDTVKLYYNANEPFQITAPQKYYKNYEWQFPNNSVIAEKSISLSYSNPGKYILNCKASDSCIDVSSTIPFEIEIADTNNVNDPIEYITLFPNPILGYIGPKLMITSSSNNVSAEVRIYASNGRLLYTFNENLEYGSTIIDYSSSFVSEGPGSYYLNFITNNSRKTFIFSKL